MRKSISSTIDQMHEVLSALVANEQKFPVKSPRAKKEFELMQQSLSLFEKEVRSSKAFKKKALR